MLDKLVEGYFITTIDNLIFEVKGIVHPYNRVIAYVRYVPDIYAATSKGCFRKIYDLKEREEYLRENFPDYLWFSRFHNRIIQAVPHRNVKQIHNPIEHMSQIRRSNSSLSIATANLVDLLIEYTGIDSESIGVTGSQLIGVSKETSDIDLVVFGKSASIEFYNKLSAIFDKIPGIDHYKGDLLINQVLFRWKDLIDYHSILNEIERKKILQGMFGTYQFFIRLVQRSKDVDEVYGQIVTNSSKHVNTKCRIIDDSNSIFTPCTYLVECKEYPLLRQLVSYRGRFTEHGSNGETVMVSGRLENVFDTQRNEDYQQLILGENSLDYMIPV